MQSDLILTVLTFMGNISIPDVLIVIVIFSIPWFFLMRRIYRKKFGDDNDKVLVRSVVASVLLSTVFVIVLITGFVLWLIATESSN
jgi:hypothetical protein